MEKKKPIRRLVTFSILPIFVLMVFFLHRRGSLSSISYDYFGNGGQFNLEQKKAKKDEVLPPSNNLHSQLKRLVREEDLAEFEATGFACDVTKVTEVCVINRAVIFDKRSRTLYVPSDDQNQTPIRMVKPYPRREDEFAMGIVAPVRIVMGKWSNINPTPGAYCQFTHSVPGLIFSYAGYLKNPFHAFNEFVIPLFLTSKHFESRVQFVFTEYRPQLAEKYSRVVQQLSAFEPVVSDDGGMQEEVHCFPAGAVVGLRKHDNLDVRSNEVPKGYTLASVRQFLWETYNVKVKTTLNVKKPKVLLISRTKSRAFLNEDEMVKMMEQELGFEVHRALPNETSSLDTFAPIVNSCDFMVGAHGAGLTNSLFLPTGAVMIQIVPLGLNWASDYYFGEPAPRIGLNYLRYKVWRNETSLYEIYGPDDPIVSDPASIYRIGPLAVTDAYLIKQNFRINLARFKGELLQGLKLLEQTQSSH